MTTRIAIFSDLHGNSAATEAVLKAIDAERLDAVYNLGDLVGYGAMPNETISFVRERGIPTIMGNYDDGVGFDRDDCGCAYTNKDEEARGQESLFWTRNVTSPENKAYLRTLLPEIRFAAEGKRFRLVHGSPLTCGGTASTARFPIQPGLPICRVERMAIKALIDLLR